MPDLESDLVDLGSLNPTVVPNMFPVLNVIWRLLFLQLERQAHHPGVLGLRAGSPHCWRNIVEDEIPPPSPVLDPGEGRCLYPADTRHPRMLLIVLTKIIPLSAILDCRLQLSFRQRSPDHSPQSLRRKAPGPGSSPSTPGVHTQALIP